jgi:hypothetical protein
MTLRPLLIPIVCSLTALAACGDGVRISATRSEDNDTHGVLRVVETLQCPQTLGSLTRKGSASAGGTVCSYVGPRGAEVSLHLVPLDGASPEAVLNAFERRLSAEMPRAVAAIHAAEAEGAQAQARADVAAAAADRAARADDRAAAAADRASAAEDRAVAARERASVRAPGVAIDADGDDATVSLPGMRIETRGDKASVRIGGFHINADDSDGSARISSDSGNGDTVNINARDDAAEIRSSTGGEATRTRWILTDTRTTNTGWRLVGFEARGPVGGPLVVATVHSRERDRESAFEDARALVALNVGE